VVNTNEKLSHEAYVRVRRSRRRNTVLAVLALAVIAGLSLFHFDVGLIWLLILSVLSLIGLAFMTDIVKFVEHSGKPKCPRCGEIIESGKFIDHKFPKNCSHCGLEITPEKTNLD
jgi:predicted RNA-binding Zn-ribbon protein involved in translation (DUF1610 family)